MELLISLIFLIGFVVGVAFARAIFNRVPSSNEDALASLESENYRLKLWIKNY